MPLFELECMECTHSFETILKHKDDFCDERCPKCGSQQLQTKMSLWGSYSIKGNNTASERPSMSRRLKK